MNSIINKWKLIVIVATVAILVSSCYSDKSVRNIEFAPNMYNSLPLEPYSQTDYTGTNTGGHLAAVTGKGPANGIFDNGLNAQKAPDGTVPRTSASWYRPEDYTPYPYANTPEGKDSAATFFSPLNNAEQNEKGYDCTEATYLRGKEVYTTFCVMCHGPNGQGQGQLVTAGVFAGVPAYNSAGVAELTEGQMFHSITYGKGIMGSYASQITPMQRWEVICYIRKFQEQ